MPRKELERLQAVDRFLKLKIGSDRELQEIVDYAAEVCEVPIAMITLIDAHTQYIRYRVGTDLVETSRADAFCNYTILEEGVMVVPDTGQDERFVNHPYRTGPTNIQFYAGASLTTVDGINLGSLCVVDHRPKQLGKVQQRILEMLSRQVVRILEFDYSLEVLKSQFLDAKDNEIKLRALFESSDACHLLIGKDLDVKYFNRTLAEFMLDRHGQKMEVGADVLNYVGDEFREIFIASFNRALGGQRVRFEDSLRHDGLEIWWHFSFSPAYDSSAQIIGVSYTATDISELKKSQMDSDSKDRALDRIAFVQSHNVRGPLSSIMGLVTLMQGSGNSKFSKETLLLKRAAEDLDNIIKSLVAEAEAGDKKEL